MNEKHNTMAPESLSHLLNTVLELTFIKRTGWLKRGIAEAQCESVAAHSFHIALWALFIGDALYPGLDTRKLLVMALLHDLAEAHTGDLTPSHPEYENKAVAEQQALQAILARHPRAEEYLAVWEEFEAQVSPEAQLVKQLDKLHMLAMATRYEHQTGIDLSEFFESSAGAITDPSLRNLLSQLS